jgi:poly(rC)-binding protein 2/3/4
LPFVDVVLPFFFIQNLESSNSPAQDAVLLVFARIVEDQIRNGFHPPSSPESPVTARLLIAPSTVNLVTGNEGEVISVLREVSGADIQLLVGEPIPDVTSDNDVVVQVQLYNSRHLCFLKGS